MAYGDPVASQYTTGGTPNAALAARDLLRAGAAYVQETTHAITGVTSFRKTSTTPGTAVAIAATTACLKVTIQALESNTDAIALGDVNTFAAMATQRGIVLYGRESVEWEVDNLADIFLDVRVSGEGVTVVYWT